MRQVLVITNFKLSNLIFPENYDDYVFSYRYLTEEQVKKEIKFNTCKAFIGKKEILNLFKIDKKVQIVEAKEYEIKEYDKILVLDNKKRYLILELLNTKKFFKLLKKIKAV